MNKNLHSTVIGIMSAGGHKVDAESKLLLEQLDAGTITNEDAIKRVYDAIEKLPTKRVVRQQDIQDFFDDQPHSNQLSFIRILIFKNKKTPKKVASCTA